MKLISMTDFVLGQEQPTYLEKEEFEDVYYKIHNYAKFLKQPLTLSMFVPCDDEGNVLEEPKYWNKKYNDDIPESELILCEEYRQAKERVVFEGFEDRYSESGYQVSNENILIVFYDAGYIVTYKACFDYKTETIESVIQFNLTITPNAVKTYQL